MDPTIALINYGIAGIVIYLFYVLVSNHLKELSKSINDLKVEIKMLREHIDTLIQILKNNKNKKKE